MNDKTTVSQLDAIQEQAAARLDQSIYEAAVQLVGGCDIVHTDPLVRFVLLCTARAQFEDEDVVGTDPELQWVRLARAAYVKAAESKGAEAGYQPVPFLLSQETSAIRSQREYYQQAIAKLVIADSDESPESHSGVDFASQVAEGRIQIRYV